MSADRLIPRDAFPAIDQTGEYHPHLAELRGFKASGVYAIIDAGSRRVLYVGESHTGRLYDTMTRHFRKWQVDPSTDQQGRKRGGTTYDRAKVRVVYLITNADVAPSVQYAEIQRLRPRDNAIDGSSVAVDEVPF